MLKARSTLWLGFLKIVNLRLSGLYLYPWERCGATTQPIGNWLGDMSSDRAEGSDGGMRVAARAYKGRPSLLRRVGTYRNLPFLKKTAGPARQPTGRRCLQKMDAVPGRPYPPCAGRTGL